MLKKIVYVGLISSALAFCPSVFANAFPSHYSLEVENMLDQHSDSTIKYEVVHYSGDRVIVDQAAADLASDDMASVELSNQASANQFVRFLVKNHKTNTESYMDFDVDPAPYLIQEHLNLDGQIILHAQGVSSSVCAFAGVATWSETSSVLHDAVSMSSGDATARSYFNSSILTSEEPANVGVMLMSCSNLAQNDPAEHFDGSSVQKASSHIS